MAGERVQNRNNKGGGGQDARQMEGEYSLLIERVAMAGRTGRGCGMSSATCLVKLTLCCPASQSQVLTGTTPFNCGWHSA